jgi:hypothetical protein
MSKVYVLHESPDWYGPLDAALSEAGVPHGELFLNTGVVDVGTPPPPGVFFNRLSGTAHTRGHVLAVEHARTLLRWLENHGRRVVNGTEALELAMSKAALCGALASFGIATPRTVAVVGLNQLEGAVEAFEGSFLVKPNRSGKGVGIQKFDSRDELVRAVDSGEFSGSADGVVVVQEYIRSPEPFITRCEFVGGELVYALASRPDGGFNLCPTDICMVPGVPADDGPRFRIREGFSHPIIATYQRFLRQHGIEVAAVEFITDDAGRPFTYDLNINTNYNADAERAAGKSGMRAIARFLSDELARLMPVPLAARA